MNVESRQHLEQTMNDLLDRAWACESDSPDYIQYIKEADRIATILNESNNGDITKKDLLVVGAPIAAAGIGYFWKERFLWQYTKTICNFERTNTFTSTAGRSMIGILRNIFRL